MDDRIREVYEQLYKEIVTVRRAVTAGRFVNYRFEPVREIVDAAARQVSVRFNKDLRSDAKMLLLLNFVNLVAAPLTIAGRAAPDEIYAAVLHDVSSLVERAARITDEKEISAHAIINALSGLWQQLNVSAFQLWE